MVLGLIQYRIILMGNSVLVACTIYTVIVKTFNLGCLGLNVIVLLLYTHSSSAYCDRVTDDCVLGATPSLFQTETYLTVYTDAWEDVCIYIEHGKMCFVIVLLRIQSSFSFH